MGRLNLSREIKFSGANESGQGKNHFPRPADNEKDWQPLPVDAQSVVCATTIHPCILFTVNCRILCTGLYLMLMPAINIPLRRDIVL